MVPRRLQILAERQQVDAAAAQVGDRVLDLGIGLAEAQHQAALGGCAKALGAGQHMERALVAGARIAHRGRQAAHRLEVLREDVRARREDRRHGLRAALEVGRQRLDPGGRGTALDGADAGRVVRRAAIRQIVPIDRREHHVVETHQRHRLGHVGRLVGVQPAARIAGVDGAKPAGAGADAAHEHDGGDAGVPALADVGAVGFLADRGQRVLANKTPHLAVAPSRADAHAQPRRLWPALRLGLAGPRIEIDRLDAVLDGGEALGRVVFASARRLGRHRLIA